MSAFAAGRLRHAVVIPVLIIAALAFTLLAANPAEAHRSKREQQIHHGLQVALHQKGDPYSYGAEGPRSFDCSGLTMYSYGKAGLYLPRTADAQGHFVRHIPKQHLRRGDLVFFTSGGHVYHVGIFLSKHHGSRYILHAPYPGRHVSRERIWTRSWFAGTLRPKHHATRAVGHRV